VSANEPDLPARRLWERGGFISSGRQDETKAAPDETSLG
jgi:hypothetical protein